MAEPYITYQNIPGYGPDVANPYANLPPTDANVQQMNRWWQAYTGGQAGGHRGTYDQFGNYRPVHQFSYTDEGRLLDSATGWDADLNNPDPGYQADLQYFRRASSGQPGTGWAVQNPPNDFWGNMGALVIAATAAGMGAGALGGAGAAGAGAEAGAAGGASSGLASTLSTLQDIMRVYGYANTARALMENPSGGNIGALVGSLAGSATGLPLAGTVGGFAGRQAGQAALGDGGGTMAETTALGGMGTGTAGGGQMDLGQLLAGLLGVGGAGYTLLGAAGTAGQQADQLRQQQALYHLLVQLATQYQGQAQGYNQQQQEALQRALQGYMQQQGIAAGLANPAADVAGAQAFYQPMSQAMRDRVGRDVYGQLAQRGSTQGGGVESMLTQAFAPYEIQLLQQAMQNYLNTQGTAAGLFGNQGPRPQPPLYGGANFPGQPNFTIPGVSGGQNLGLSAGLAGLSPAVQALVRGLGLGPSTGNVPSAPYGSGGSAIQPATIDPSGGISTGTGTVDSSAAWDWGSSPTAVDYDPGLFG